jgi:hypothetical protein
MALLSRLSLLYDRRPSRPFSSVQELGNGHKATSRFEFYKPRRANSTIQLAQSKELLSIVQSLETTLSTMPQGEARSIVEQTAKRLLGVASILA